LAQPLRRQPPDGQQIAFMGRTVNTNYRAYLISANATNLRELVPGAEAGYDPGWSPDGKSIIVTLSDPFYAGYSGQGHSGISIVDITSGKVSKLPSSDDYFSPRWSPDGKYIAVITRDSEKLVLFDNATRQWSDLTSPPTGPIGFPSWSHDSQYLYFDTTFTDDPGFSRIRISDRKLEKVLSLKGMHRFRAEFGPWSGLAPDDSPLLARDISSQEIYSLDWEAP
jgi:Tol biopolymer transport system component